ncbi:hypothetical protein [Deinococcus sp. 6GRE01]|uniref:hypothetical protein n=1 Tax=Deinococcus sp. 6GRE01 TaxID=2745873 RepID=UPI001E2B27CA|nr:hypothetical protein [Deinococcus sp. 6GRE01]MCD0155932.1 hypothetical protein [Deinococcus sp. 6GRE01]
MLRGLQSGITLGQLLGGHLPALWWAWAITPPIVLLITVLLGRRRGSRLFAAGVMLIPSWTGGLLLHGLVAGAVRVMLRGATS